MQISVLLPIYDHTDMEWKRIKPLCTEKVDEFCAMNFSHCPLQ